MASSSKVLLVLGAGPNIGAALVSKFAQAGYRVAITSRKAPTSTSNDNALHVQADVSQVNTIPGVFEKVKKELGVPSVVVYNAAGVHRNPPDDPLALPLSEFDDDINVNTRGLFVAAKEFVANTKTGTFIYTGNILNTGSVVIPPLMMLGVGKAASARIIHSAADAYKDKGIRFYYADERTAEGKPMYSGLSGAAHAEHYLDLAEADAQREWWQTFAQGEGYKKFP